jgi:hypothetical protein
MRMYNWVVGWISFAGSMAAVSEVVVKCLNGWDAPVWQGVDGITKANDGCDIVVGRRECKGEVVWCELEEVVRSKKWVIVVAASYCHEIEHAAATMAITCSTLHLQTNAAVWRHWK